MDTGDLRLVETLIRDAMAEIRTDFEGRLGLSAAEIDGMIYSHLEPLIGRIDALEMPPPAIEIVEPVPPPEDEPVSEIIAAEAEAEVAVIEAEAEAAVEIIEAAAENDVPVVAVVTTPEGEPEILPAPDGTTIEGEPDGDEFPEMAVIITPETGSEPAPQRGGFWNSPIFGGRR